MRQILLTFFVGFLVLNLKGQTDESLKEGAVSYITAQSVYVRFQSTESFAQGDTLFAYQDGKPAPALVIRQLSSISCVCDPVSTYQPVVGDKVFFRIAVQTVLPSEEAATPVEPVAVPPEPADTTRSADSKKSARIQRLNGRLSVSSYLNFSDTDADDVRRMRYTFAMDGRNLGGTRLSAETYISFAHRLDRWQDIRDNVFNGLKIYSLALSYDFNERTRLLLGRKINPRMSSLGAVDGLQFESGFRSFTAGIFGGARPDFRYYGFNDTLTQFGAYLSHDYKAGQGMMQSTLAFAQQMNHGNTDRRFAYLQHTNTLVRKLYFFGSAEIDLYEVVDGKSMSSFNLTNLYLLMRYQIIRQLSLSFSYSARNNIIYYETYKNRIEELLDMEALQGFRLQVNYRPVKYLSVGITGNYRYRKEDPEPTKNLYGYLTYNRIPVLGISATLSATLMESSYFTGRIYGAGISRDFARGKLQAGINYHYVDYDFSSTDIPLVQHLGEASLQWRIFNKSSLAVYYEGTFESEQTFHRVYLNLTQRF